MSAQPGSSTSRKVLRGITRELIIPIILALIVIQFVIQAFRIPTGSMEDHLLVGDFLLGLKFVYGIDLPITDARITISEPDQGDVVIFRYPGDPIIPDYDRERYSFIADLLMFGKFYMDHDAKGDAPSFIHSPESPKDFIKRCVAVGGQTIKIVNKHVFVDDKEFKLPKKGKFREEQNLDIRDNYGPYTLPKSGDVFKLDTLSLKALYNLKSIITQENPGKTIELSINMYKGDSAIDDYKFKDFSFPPDFRGYHSLEILLKTRPDIITITPSSYSNRYIFDIAFKLFSEHARTGFVSRPIPNAVGRFTRTVSYNYFEPDLLNILESNVSSLNTNDSTADSTSQYRLEYSLLVDGKSIDAYTIEENTFFMMGDNRHNSDDSRFWGVVSNKNIKAKAFITYFSFNDPEENTREYNRRDDFRILNPFTWYMIPGKVRWSRVGKLIHNVK